MHPFHKNEALTKLMKSRGYILEFLPAHSPDLNPIEEQMD